MEYCVSFSLFSCGQCIVFLQYSVHIFYFVSSTGLAVVIGDPLEDRQNFHPSPCIHSSAALHRGLVRFMVFNATFNNISAISWWSVLLVEKTRVPGENHHPVASH